MPRRLILLLTALTVFMLASASSALASAGAQNSVRAFTTADQARAGLTSLESPCTRQDSTGSTARSVAGFCVAAEEGGPSGTPNFDNLGESPGPGWEWRGPADKGSWYNPETGESLHPDLEHPEPIGPHYDYRAPDGQFYRIFPDGTVVPK